MKLYPFTRNGEVFLREENKYQSPNIYSCRTADEIANYDSFEKQAIESAIPIINPDGREWYEETDLEKVWQYKMKDDGRWITERQSFGHETRQAYRLKTIQVYAYGKKSAQEANPFELQELFNSGSNYERARIISLIDSEITQLEYSSNGFKPTDVIDLLTELKTKINDENV